MPMHQLNIEQKAKCSTPLHTLLYFFLIKNTYLCNKIAQIKL